MTSPTFTIATDACAIPTHTGVTNTRFGSLAVSWNPTVICQIAFSDSLNNSHQEFIRDDSFVDGFANRLFGRFNNDALPRIVLTGTEFQQAVLLAVAAIPRGETRTYLQIATTIAHPKATRAVGSAVASNQLAVLIPCHRVIRSDGAIGNYRWGSGIKSALLEWENEA